MQFLNDLSEAEQRPAVRAFLDGRNVAAVAGAGAGKTWTLTTLLAALLAPTNPQKADVEEIVAFTYTEKAASEMKAGLRRRISGLRRTDTAAEPGAWKRVEERLPLLSIGTFHSFCQRLISAYPVEAEVDPAFAVADETTAGMLIDEVTHELLQALRDVGSPDLNELLATFAIDKLADLIGSVLRTLRMRGVTVAQAVEETEAAGGAISASLSAFRSSVEGWLAFDGKAPATRPLVAMRWAALKDRLIPERIDALLMDEIDRLAGTPDARGSLKPLVAEIRSSSAEIGNWHACRLAVRVLGLVEKVWAEYDLRKQPLGLLDFDDLVWKARQALRHPVVVARVSARIRHILVDEFQDTDQLQVEVIRLLLGLDSPDVPLPPGRLFVVGDRKQSIYRFRGAQVDVSDGVIDRLQRDGGTLQPLRVNYRSRPAIIRFANVLFREFGVVATEADEMAADREQGVEAGSVELLLCDGASGGAPDGALDSASGGAPGSAPGGGPDGAPGGAPRGGKASRTDEAALIAGRIRQLFAGGRHVYDKQTRQERPLAFGDIAILFRSTTNVQTYAQALADAGIPHYVVSGRGLFDQEEVQDLVNLLQAVINPSDGLSLFGALRGPVFALRDDTLFLLIDGAGKDLHAGLARAGELLAPGEERERALRAWRVLAALRESVRREPAPRALDELFRQTGFMEMLAAAADGEQRVANIRKIARWVRQDGSGLQDLPALVRWLQLNRDREVREGPAATAAEHDPRTVKLLTDHKAKGLEWPVVILADAGSKPSGGSDGARYRPGQGLALRLKGPLGEDVGNALWDQFAEAAAAEEAEEELRLFYVGCTRARDLLIISGRMEPGSGSWLAQLLAEVEGEDWAGGPVRVLRRDDVPCAVAAVDAVPVDMDALPSMAELLQRTGPVTAGYGADPVPASSSKLMDLQACRRRYYLRYVLGMPEPAQGSGGHVDMEEVEPTEWVDPTVRGQVIHWICERLREPGQLPLLIEQALHEFGVTASSLADVAAAQVGALAATPLFERMRSGRMKTEVPFSLRIGGLLIEGRIDALGVDASGVPLLVDYKTNHVESPAQVPELARGYELQMGIYALAARSLGLPVTAPILYFTEPGVAHPVPVDLGAVEDRVAELGALLRGASLDICDYPQEPGSCWKCRFRAVCGT